MEASFIGANRYDSLPQIGGNDRSSQEDQAVQAHECQPDQSKRSHLKEQDLEEELTKNGPYEEGPADSRTHGASQEPSYGQGQWVVVILGIPRLLGTRD
jgi:hypothetical protein